MHKEANAHELELHSSIKTNVLNVIFRANFGWQNSDYGLRLSGKFQKINFQWQLWMAYISHIVCPKYHKYTKISHI